LYKSCRHSCKVCFILGYIQTASGAFQIVGAPLFGYIVQRSGIRFGLQLCYISTVLSAILLLLADDVTTLVLSRIPCVLMQSAQAHQALISLQTSPGQERTIAFGRLGLIFGFSFVLTPLLSMVAVSIASEQGPILLSSVLSLLPLLVLKLGVEQTSYESDASSNPAVTPLPENNGSDLYSVVRVLRRPGVLNVMFKKYAAHLPHILIVAVLQLHIVEQFQSTQQTGQLIQMIMGLCMMLSSGFGVMWLRKLFNEQALLFLGLLSFSVTYALFMVLYRLWVVFIILPFLAIGMSLVDTASDSLLTSLVSENEQGLILGVVASVFSLVRTLAPTISGYIIEKHGFSTLAIIGFMSTACGHAVMFLLPINENLLTKPKSE
uniref:MFS domain-containing protein n=1 Tax=Nippostrongylus brasiliensis TaxID=27835 RepID=A0A158R114_NIPBR